MNSKRKVSIHNHVYTNETRYPISHKSVWLALDTMPKEGDNYADTASICINLIWFN